MGKLIQPEDCPQCEESNEGWIFTYADMITLLFCFFVILYSMCPTGSNGKGGKPANYSVLPPGGAAAFSGNSSPAEELAGELEKLDMPDNVDLNVSNKGVEVSFREKILFEPGSIEISATAQVTLIQAVQTLINFPNQILVGGHADKEADTSTKYPSTWELSTARASAVAAFLEAKGVPSQQIEINGYGQFEPLFFSDTSYKRGLNRRVEITLMPKKASCPLCGKKKSE